MLKKLVGFERVTFSISATCSVCSITLVDCVSLLRTVYTKTLNNDFS